MAPFPTKSLGGASYVLTFIDYFNRMTFDYLIEHKDQTFDRFKDFKALVENQFGFNIKMLTFDNGGEYNSNEFNDFLPSMESRGNLLSLTLLSRMVLPKGRIEPFRK